MGAKDLEQRTNRKFTFNDETISHLLAYIQSKTGLPLTQRHFITAEKDSQSIQSRQSAYLALKRQ